MGSEQETPGATPPKSSADYVEEKGFNDSLDPTRFLSDAHKAYLIERHGTLDIDPIPSMDPADPYNWPLWKVRKNAMLDLYIADSLTENGEPESGRFPRLYGHVYCRCYYLRLRRHRCRSRSLHPAGIILDVSSNCHPRRSPVVLEAPFPQIWTPPGLSPLADVELCL